MAPRSSRSRSTMAWSISPVALSCNDSDRCSARRHIRPAARRVRRACLGGSRGITPAPGPDAAVGGALVMDYRQGCRTWRRDAAPVVRHLVIGLSARGLRGMRFTPKRYLTECSGLSAALLGCDRAPARSIFITIVESEPRHLNRGQYKTEDPLDVLSDTGLSLQYVIDYYDKCSRSISEMLEVFVQRPSSYGNLVAGRRPLP